MAVSDALPQLRMTPARAPRAMLLLAHGAGAPMDSEFMEQMALAVSEHGITVARFEFPYMHRRRVEGRKFPPDRAPRLLERFSHVVAQVSEAGLPVWLAGKSMGGRMASMLAADPALCPQEVRGVVALGYPFHPPGKPEKTRTEHLGDLAIPMLICQGTRDPFGKPDEVLSYGLPSNVQLYWLDGGDHDFKPLKRSGLEQRDLIINAATQIARFVSA